MERQILPSVLSADFTALHEDLKRIERAGARILHVDIMDGIFVPNVTFGPVIVRAIRQATSLHLDVHLMVDDPVTWIDWLDTVQPLYAISFHLEATPHWHAIVQKIKARGLKAGVALNPGTPVHWLESLIHDVDYVLVMSVNPGFAGQPFLPFALEKVRLVRELIDIRGSSAIVEIDGGIKLHNIQQAVVEVVQLQQVVELKLVEGF